MLAIGLVALLTESTTSTGDPDVQTAAARLAIRLDEPPADRGGVQNLSEVVCQKTRRRTMADHFQEIAADQKFNAEDRAERWDTMRTALEQLNLDTPTNDLMPVPRR